LKESRFKGSGKTGSGRALLSKPDSNYEEIRIRYDYKYNSEENEGPLISNISDGLNNKKGSAKSR